MGEEIESLNSAFGQLERENQQKDEQIKGLKQKIIILAKAYE
jgi:cell division protein FtsB